MNAIETTKTGTWKPLLSLREDARQRCLEEGRHVLGLLPSLVEHKGAVGRKEEGEGEEDAFTGRRKSSGRVDLFPTV